MSRSHFFFVKYVVHVLPGVIFLYTNNDFENTYSNKYTGTYCWMHFSPVIYDIYS